MNHPSKVNIVDVVDLMYWLILVTDPLTDLCLVDLFIFCGVICVLFDAFFFCYSLEEDIVSTVFG